mgnify:CR=1 FL=1
MNLRELKCKNCGAPLTESNLSLDIMVARCPHCESVFAIDPEDEETDGKEPLKPRAALPRGWYLRDDDYRLLIQWRWFQWGHIVALMFSIPWNTFVIFWMYKTLSMGVWFMSVFGLVHAGVGIGLVYYAFSGMLNSTLITADSESLQIRHRPLPWVGNRTIATADIRQLYCKEKVTQNKNGTSVTYELCALEGESHRTLPLIKGLADVEQAVFLEQELERHLHIRDRKVAGEVRL